LGERTQGGREFDLVIDTTLTQALKPSCGGVICGARGRYIFLSTGQVYLVRVGVERPYKEEIIQGR